MSWEEKAKPYWKYLYRCLPNAYVWTSGKNHKNVCLLFWQLLFICSLVKNFRSLFNMYPTQAPRSEHLIPACLWMKGCGVRGVLPATMGRTTPVMAPGTGLTLSSHRVSVAEVWGRSCLVFWFPLEVRNLLFKRNSVIARCLTHRTVKRHWVNCWRNPI